MARRDRLRSLLLATVVGGSLWLFACGEDEATTSFMVCNYPESSTGPDQNAVEVAGGATCDEAAILFRGGPAFQDLEPHPFSERVSAPELEGDWICEAEQPGGKGTELHVNCEDGARQVHYVFH